MAATSLSLSLGLPSAANNLNRHAALNIITCENTSPNQDRSCTRRPFLLGAGALSLSLIPASPLLAQGRYYTLIVGANERRWRKFRNKLKVVADI
ncbi:hypothetical protein K7X08_002513 [Anisodus acutangulus]|uniref:Uncharacterized protein n=1 Tax=Anisodus acutangulus TaxID=402998 RepID=A0A9Q1LPL2_9SOLA|nr:hypothetical protein K7X08_002513 [Anisodus acutangulus]